jgi:hypothetical protein
MYRVSEERQNRVVRDYMHIQQRCLQEHKLVDKIYPTITHFVDTSDCKGLGLGCDTMLS